MLLRSGKVIRCSQVDCCSASSASLYTIRRRIQGALRKVGGPATPISSSSGSHRPGSSSSSSFCVLRPGTISCHLLCAGSCHPRSRLFHPSLLLEDRRPQPTPHRPSSTCCRRTRRAPSPLRRRHSVARHAVGVRDSTSRTPPAVHRPARCARLHLWHDGAICHRLGQRRMSLDPARHQRLTMASRAQLRFHVRRHTDDGGDEGVLGRGGYVGGGVQPQE
jgi:hypothetical protein